jgi:hypothetical protein
MDPVLTAAIIGAVATVAAAIVGAILSKHRKADPPAPEATGAPASQPPPKGTMQPLDLDPLSAISLEAGEYEGHSIRYSDVTANTLRSLAIDRARFLELLAAELRSHPLLTRLDYESLPIPLKGGFFVVVSKLGKRLFVESVFRSAPSPGVFQSWKALTAQYFLAYRLPFREVSESLADPGTFDQAFKTVGELGLLTQKYMHEVWSFATPEILGRLHDLKSGIATGLTTAEFWYADYTETKSRDSLTKVILGLERAISCAHKVLIEYQPPQ